MTHQKIIKKFFERCELALKMLPFLGQKNEKVTVRTGKGLVCKEECESGTYQIDMPSQVGGGATAPTPIIES